MTLTWWLPALISAPSKAIMSRTPLIWPRLASCWLVSPAGATISRSGRMICRNEAASWPAAVAAARSLPDRAGRAAGARRTPRRPAGPARCSRRRPGRRARASADGGAARSSACGAAAAPITRPIIAIHPNPISGPMCSRPRPTAAMTRPDNQWGSARPPEIGSQSGGCRAVTQVSERWTSGAGNHSCRHALPGPARCDSRPPASLGRMPMSMFGLGTRAADRGAHRPVRAGRAGGGGGLGRLRGVRAAGRPGSPTGSGSAGCCARMAAVLRGRHRRASSACAELRAPVWALLLTGGAGRGVHAVARVDGPGPLERAAAATRPLLHTAFSLESVVDEMIFVIGPALVTAAGHRGLSRRRRAGGRGGLRDRDAAARRAAAAPSRAAARRPPRRPAGGRGPRARAPAGCRSRRRPGHPGAGLPLLGAMFAHDRPEHGGLRPGARAQAAGRAACSAPTRWAAPSAASGTGRGPGARRWSGGSRSRWSCDLGRGRDVLGHARARRRWRGHLLSPGWRSRRRSSPGFGLIERQAPAAAGPRA